MPENRLATGQTSPYLLQHAHNPVDWYPWGPEALERARSAERPLIVSIGYAACHWCHVMERESFEDTETAALMNEHFVSIKVDREERPDIDAVYMDAAQALTGSGGWPLNAFCTPEGVPFFVGTYFPPEPRGGQPSFRQVLAGIAQAWSERREELLDQGSRVVRAISRTSTMEPSDEAPGESVLVGAMEPLLGGFDAEWGGFGGAPKFPQPMTLDFLLRMRLRGDDRAGAMVGRTLERMAAGGIYDQVAGGFARYSVDRRWHVPHFEKMLYDNAQLARTYLHAWQLDGVDDFARVTRETLGYLLSDLRGPEGGFFSSQDADSEGREGAFAVWTWDELVGAVGEEVATTFGATPEGNWAAEGIRDGSNVLWRPPLSDPPADEAALQRARAILLKIRRRRVPPATDDKVLAAWNGLAVTALAEAGTALQDANYLDAAVRAGEFVLGELRSEDGGLARSWRAGAVSGPGYADDYALVAEACLALYEATSEVRWFRSARQLCDDLLARFADAEHGGFFQTGSGAESLVVRPKELLDNATPSGNSVAADVLARMALFTGEARYEESAAAALRLVREHMLRAPSAFGRALCALDLSVSRPPEIAIVGDLTAEDTRALVRVVTGSFRPNRVLAVADPRDEEARRDVPLLEGRTAEQGHATAYVCERFACKLPVRDPEALAAELRPNT